MLVGIMIGFVIGVICGSMVGVLMDFDWEAYFRYQTKKDEMRIKTAMEITEAKGE